MTFSANEDNDICNGGGSWEDLPALVISSIMRRLNAFDNRNLQVVCKFWRIAYEQFPESLRHCDHDVDDQPWLMTSNKGKLQFSQISSLNGGNYKIDFPIEVAHHGSSVLCSSKGWLALRLSHPNWSRIPIILYNVFTSKRISMPENVIEPQLATMLFEKDITPSYLLTATCFTEKGRLGRLDLTIASPADESWELESYSSANLTVGNSIKHLYVVGNNVCFIDNCGWIFAFDMVSRKWRESSVRAIKAIKNTPNCLWYSKSFVVENNGEILRLDVGFDLKHSAKRINRKHYQGVCKLIISDVALYKMSTDCMAWEILDKSELKGKTWFLDADKKSGFVSTKGAPSTTNKLYLFYNEYDAYAVHNLDEFFDGHGKNILEKLKVRFDSNLDKLFDGNNDSMPASHSVCLDGTTLSLLDYHNPVRAAHPLKFHWISVGNLDYFLKYYPEEVIGFK